MIQEAIINEIHPTDAWYGDKWLRWKTVIVEESWPTNEDGYVGMRGWLFISDRYRYIVFYKVNLKITHTYPER